MKKVNPVNIEVAKLKKKNDQKVREEEHLEYLEDDRDYYKERYRHYHHVANDAMNHAMKALGTDEAQFGIKYAHREMEHYFEEHVEKYIDTDLKAQVEEVVKDIIKKDILTSCNDHFSFYHDGHRTHEDNGYTIIVSLPKLNKAIHIDHRQIVHSMREKQGRRS